MHPAVWFLILFLDIFAFTRLERVLEDKKRLDILKRNFLQERYLWTARSLNATEIRTLLQEKLVDPNAYDCKGGALNRIVNRSTKSARMLDSVRAVLEHKDANPNGVGNHWPPLKIALSRGHHEAAQVLLSHPRTKKEIDPAELSCELIEQLPDEVRLSYDPQCMCMIRTTFDNIMDAFSSIGIILDESSYDVCGWFPNVCNEFSFFIFWLRLPFSCFVIIIVSEQFIDTLFSRIGDHVFSMAGYHPGWIAVLLLEDL